MACATFPHTVNDDRAGFVFLRTLLDEVLDDEGKKFIDNVGWAAVQRDLFGFTRRSIKVVKGTIGYE